MSVRAVLSKGNPVNIPELRVGTVWQHKQTWRQQQGAWEELSFLFNRWGDRGSRLTGETVVLRGKHIISDVSGASLMFLENPGERFICTLSRTHNRIRSPR